MITIREMQIDDLEQVMPIERPTFRFRGQKPDFLHF